MILKFLEILKTAGSVAVSTMFPAAVPIIAGINAMLPTDKQLPMDATGEQVSKRLEGLPPDVRAEIHAKDVDLEIAEVKSWAAIQHSLAQADIAGASTRPWIARMMAICVFFAVVVFISVWAYAIMMEKSEVLDQISGSWQMMLTILATPTTLLRFYFGKRTEEKNNRMCALNKQPVQAGGLSSIINMFRK